VLVINLKPYYAQESSTKMRAAQKKLANGSGQLPIGRLSSKGPMKQKLHPGMLSTQDRATAHYGAVTGLKVTEDGMYLLSAGCLLVIYHTNQ
jgi:DNA excision repair protein ERCC-8